MLDRVAKGPCPKVCQAISISKSKRKEVTDLLVMTHVRNTRFLLIMFFALTNMIFGQNKKFERLLKKNLKRTVPVLRVSDVDTDLDYVFFDTRENKEFAVSHIEDAVFVGFDFFDLQKIEKTYPDKTKPIIVYCSIGVRSELIGEKLLKAGYKNVHNLYGGIFEWKNQSKTVIDAANQKTEKVHTYSKEWSKWLLKGEKVYED